MLHLAINRYFSTYFQAPKSRRTKNCAVAGSCLRLTLYRSDLLVAKTLSDTTEVRRGNGGKGPRVLEFWPSSLKLIFSDFLSGINHLVSTEGR